MLISRGTLAPGFVGTALGAMPGQGGRPARASSSVSGAHSRIAIRHHPFAAGGPAPAEFGAWTTAEKIRFINSLPRKLTAPRLDELNRTLGLNQAGNNEVLFAWLGLAVANKYQPAVPAIEQFLLTQGRRKFVRPLIEALAEDRQWGRPIAVRIYSRARPSYHAVTTADLDKLGLIAT